MGLTELGLRNVELNAREMGLEGILSERTAEALGRAIRRVERYNALHTESNIGGGPVIRCSGDHTLFHATTSVEDTVAILEKGFRPKRDHFKPGIWDYLPATFFSGSMLTIGDYGKIVLVTHTQALKEADRLVVRPSLKDVGEKELAEHLYAPSLKEREKEYLELLQPIFDELNEQRKAGEISDYDESRLFEEMARPYKGLARGIERDGKRAMMLYRILRGLRLAPTPCQYLERMEKRTASGAPVAARDVEMATRIRSQIMDEDAEHVLLGFDNDYVMPSDGIGVGLVGDDIEKDALANALARKNVRFRYVSRADCDGNVEQLGGGVPKLLTHVDFPKQGNSRHIPFETYASLDMKSSGWDSGWLQNGTSTTWGRGGAGILVIAPESREVLLLMRSSFVEEPGLLGIPGGARKETVTGLEDALVTAVVESKEEMGGLPVGKMRRQPYAYQVPGTDFTYLTYVLEVSKDVRKRFKPVLNWENTAYGWYKMGSFGKLPVHPGVRAVLVKVAQA